MATVEVTRDGQRATCRRCGAAAAARADRPGRRHGSRTRDEALRRLSAAACVCPAGPHRHAPDPTPAGCEVWADHCGRAVKCWVDGRAVLCPAGAVPPAVPLVVRAAAAGDWESAGRFADVLRGLGHARVRTEVVAPPAAPPAGGD